MIKLGIEEYKHEQVYFVKKGYSKHYLYFDNVDVLNTILFFSCFMFNDFEIDIDCDKDFWRDWVDYFQDETKIKKNIKFTGSKINIAEQKIDSSFLWYTGGKDSMYAYEKRPDLGLIQFIAQVYGVRLHPVSKKVSSNFDNEIFHCRVGLRKWLRTELFFPLISPYTNNYFGYEKELWDNSKVLCMYDFSKYKKLFDSHGLIYDSPSKEVYSNEIIKYFYDKNIEIIKCNSTDSGKENEYCYTCTKCLIAYGMGCDLKEHGFDRDKFKERMIYRNKPLYSDYVKWFCEFNNFSYATDFYLKIGEMNNVT